MTKLKPRLRYIPKGQNGLEFYRNLYNSGKIDPLTYTKIVASDPNNYAQIYSTYSIPQEKVDLSSYEDNIDYIKSLIGTKSSKNTDSSKVSTPMTDKQLESYNKAHNPEFLQIKVNIPTIDDPKNPRNRIRTFNDNLSQNKSIESTKDWNAIAKANDFENMEAVRDLQIRYNNFARNHGLKEISEDGKYGKDTKNAYNLMGRTKRILTEKTQGRHYNGDGTITKNDSGRVTYNPNYWKQDKNGDIIPINQNMGNFSNSSNTIKWNKSYGSKEMIDNDFTEYAFVNGKDYRKNSKGQIFVRIPGFLGATYQEVDSNLQPIKKDNNKSQMSEQEANEIIAQYGQFGPWGQLIKKYGQ